MIVVAVSLGLCSVFRLYFLHSNFWICLSALAIMEEIAISKKLSESVVALYVMVLSAPVVEYGHGVRVDSFMVRSGFKEMSNGLAEASLVLIRGFSTLMGVVFLMYPAVACWNTSTWLRQQEHSTPTSTARPDPRTRDVRPG